MWLHVHEERVLEVSAVLVPLLIGLVPAIMPCFAVC